MFRRSGYDGYPLLLLALPMVSHMEFERQVGLSVFVIASAAGSLDYLFDPALLFPLLTVRHMQLT